MPAQSPSEVRSIVVEEFRRQGLAAREEMIGETILIRDGRYRGRSYRMSGLMAMWMVDIGLVQVYGAEGQMLATISLPDRPSTHRAAA